MGDHAFDLLSHFLRSLSADRTRRTFVAGVSGLGLAAFGLTDGAAHNPLPACNKHKSAKKRRACRRRARAHNRTQHPLRKPNAACQGIGNLSGLGGATGQFAQTFTEPNGGLLTGVKLSFFQSPDAVGNYVVQLNTVDNSTGVPTTTSLAAAEVSQLVVPFGSPGIVGASFPFPATLVKGQRYAIVLGKPSGTGGFTLAFQDPGTCPGGEAYAGLGAGLGFVAIANGGVSSDFAYYETIVQP